MADVLSQTRGLVERNQKVNKDLITEMVARLLDQTDLVSVLVKQITERTERGQTETLGHCKSMILEMSQTILEQTQRQVQKVTQQQRADIEEMRTEFSRKCRDITMSLIDRIPKRMDGLAAW